MARRRVTGREVAFAVLCGTGTVLVITVVAVLNQGTVAGGLAAGIIPGILIASVMIIADMFRDRPSEK
ncbi:hypothetical protein GCM10023074_65440 [Microbispora amethystogenes]|uniref:Uncharacterized protein n=1 Tax=Microbispora amethystogenes TaxID=1427754 RepID=A0ABQ4FMG0_9ACTN|nr:hypothetical protein Mam01_61210 [Microbispora amethystogenes]